MTVFRCQKDNDSFPGTFYSIALSMQTFLQLDKNTAFCTPEIVVDVKGNLHLHILYGRSSRMIFA